MGFVLITSFLIFGVGAAAAQFHGAAVAKSTQGPVKIGDAYVSSAQFSNIVDEEQDILRVTGLSDTVVAASGNVSSGLTGVGLVFNTQVFAAIPAGSITCDGTGAGTAGDPRVNWTECFLDFNTRITTVPFSFYTVQPGDYNLPNHQLENTITWTWNNTCKPGTTNCATDPQTATAGASAILLKRDSATATDIHDPDHQIVTTVEVGTTVHDFVTVSSADGGPTPTGNVNIDWFLNGDCTGSPAANSGSVGPLDGNGQFDATAFAFTVNLPGLRSFKAHYEGDGTYNGSDGACEPLRVVDANIQITPPEAVNPINTNHTLTGHVNVNDGTGFVNAPDGTEITFTITSGPGSFVGGVDSCMTAGGTGSCTVDITSPSPGTTVVKASTDVTVSGVALHRETGDGHAGDSENAEKEWVGARISIAPDATNEVGDPHTFTVTVERDTGSGVVPATGSHVDVTLTDSNGASHTTPTGTCTDAGPNVDASGQCTITFTSPDAGQVTGHAAASVPIPGDGNVTVETDGQGENSDDAVKTFVDAFIEITPELDTNPVTATHTFTGHVEIDAGDGAGFVNAPDDTEITFTIDSGVGTLGTPNPCETSGGTGSCTITLTTAETGTTVVSAHTTVTVGGVPLTRHTDGTGNNSGPATKLWANANARTDIHNANHGVVVSVLTGTVVHDKAFVTRDATTPASVPDPTGSITFHRYSTIDCTGEAVDETVPLGGDGTAESSSFTATANMSYKASYSGDDNYPAADGACEPLTVTTPPPPPPPPPPVPNARISITPATATNPVNTNHVLTAHVDVQANTGAAFVSAPDGTQITFSIASGPGSFTTANPCTTAGGTGSCTITLTSAIAGTTVVNATTVVTVSGIPLTRTTNGQNGNSGPAEKLWQVFTPPAPVCDSLAATPRQLKVGSALTVVARVLLDNGNPMANARVRLTAPGINQVHRTNAQGVARFKIKPRKTGIARLSVIGSPQCTARRGIIGVFKPPVTG